jgi:hypothetical protein
MIEAQGLKSGCWSNCRALTTGLSLRTGNARDGEKRYEAFGRSSELRGIVPFR